MVIKLPRSRESTPVAVTPPSTPLGPKRTSKTRRGRVDGSRALDEQYDLLIAAPDSEKSLADNFGGHPLPIQHLARFWPRIANFQETTCHYHPTIA